MEQVRNGRIMADNQTKDEASKLMGAGRGNDYSWGKCTGHWNNCFHLPGLLPSQHCRLCPCVIACVCPCVAAHTRTRRGLTGSSSHGQARWLAQWINTAKHCRGNGPVPLTRSVSGRYFLVSEVWCVFWSTLQRAWVLKVHFNHWHLSAVSIMYWAN